MKKTINLLSLILLLTSCYNFGDQQNPLYGIVYRNEGEVVAFRKYKPVGGSIIDNTKNTSKKDEFGISHLKDSLKNILTFEKLVRDANNPQPSHQLLDTINIDNIKPNEHITYCTCRQDTLFDSEIIALVVADKEEEYYYTIAKAWRADTKTGKIVLLTDTKGISCINEGYGLDSDVETEIR